MKKNNQQKKQKPNQNRNNYNRSATPDHMKETMNVATAEKGKQTTKNQT